MNDYKGTEEQFEIYYTATHCQCCGIEFSTDYPKNQDHCHKTGKIRGVICRTCNLVEGMIKDQERLLSLYNYMNNHKDRP